MATAKPLTTFSTLPAELQNGIYELSGCLDLIQCSAAERLFRADHYHLAARAEPNPFASATLAYTDRPAYVGIRRKSSTDDHGRCHMKALTSWRESYVCHTIKVVRADTLPIYYGKHLFYFTFLDVNQDEGTLLRWLSMIGSHNASLLLNVIIVYSNKASANCIIKNVQPEMAKLGVRVQEAVKLVRTLYPHCSCDGCVVPTLVAGGADEMEV
ncbi:hypothetical protein B0A55_12327 [Friedmanniomyces simplex]|uniref:Uncharacterized protein n=1 Tax=Friedmanniomyces simplex TaxID=329884 RepID=A0A4U0WCV7_9PEZI|nr:hypothetical protein B0A55_12327 [Friedmanniomyces simplex]